MSSPTEVNAQMTNAVTQASKGMFIGDAVSMPVHWYYNAQQIKEDYNGWITKYEEPKDIHPGSKGLSLPKPVTVDGKDFQLIGDVILKDKTKAYSKDAKATHYHQGEKAGDNTLNCYCMLMTMKLLKTCDDSASIDDVAKKIFSNYVEFMTTPGTHPDTYAEGFHKNFFVDWLMAGKPTNSDVLYKFVVERGERINANPTDDHSPIIGCFSASLPLILHHIRKPVDEIIKMAVLVNGTAHPVEEVLDAMKSFIRLLHAVVHGASLRNEVEKAFIEYIGSNGNNLLKKFDKMVEESSSDKLAAFQAIAKELGLSCTINQAFPLVLYLARHFHDDFEGGILVNVNIGGDNCARGPSLGALLGAVIGAKGQKIPQKWTKGLVLNATLDQLLS